MVAIEFWAIERRVPVTFDFMFTLRLARLEDTEPNISLCTRINSVWLDLTRKAQTFSITQSKI